MARNHGKNVNFSFNGVAIESDLEEVTQTINKNEAEITSFTDATGNFLPGKTNATYDLSGTLDMAAAMADVTLFGQIGAGVVSTIYDPTGSGPGADTPTYNCTASGLTGVLVRRYSLNLPVGGKASFKAALQVSGALTRAVA